MLTVLDFSFSCFVIRAINPRVILSKFSTSAWWPKKQLSTYIGASFIVYQVKAYLRTCTDPAIARGAHCLWLEGRWVREPGHREGLYYSPPSWQIGTLCIFRSNAIHFIWTHPRGYTGETWCPHKQAANSIDIDLVAQGTAGYIRQTRKSCREKLRPQDIQAWIWSLFCKGNGDAKQGEEFRSHLNHLQARNSGRKHGREGVRFARDLITKKNYAL